MARYSGGAIAFHWSVAALILVNLALGLGHESLLDGQRWVMPLHKSIGLTVLALSVGRLGWRLAHRPPPMAPDARWAHRLAGAVHAAFYALMILVPLAGWEIGRASCRERV